MSYSTSAQICYGILLKDGQYEKLDDAYDPDVETTLYGDGRGDTSQILCVKGTVFCAESVIEVSPDRLLGFSVQFPEFDRKLRAFIEKYHLETEGDICWLLSWCTV